MNDPIIEVPATPVVATALGTTSPIPPAVVTDPQEEERSAERAHERERWNREFTSPKFKLPEPKPSFQFKAPLEHGWLLRYLLPVESMFWGRWDHWADTMMAGKVLSNPIPQMPWCEGSPGNGAGRKAFLHALNQVTRYGTWNTWGSWSYFEYFMDWLLFGFGHGGQKTEPTPPAGCEGASERLYQSFNLAPVVLYPADYLGDILAENAHGRHLGFYPTPMNLCHLMTLMTMDGEDCRTKTVCDPCVGTGRMLLAASNFSYRLYAMDINPIVIKATLVNGYLYAPWLVRPFPFLDRANLDPACAAKLSDQMAEVAATDPRAAAYTDWFATEHDPLTQPALHPIKIRRKKTVPESRPQNVQYELVL